jgi:hypothetical protein
MVFFMFEKEKKSDHSRLWRFEVHAEVYANNVAWFKPENQVEIRKARYLLVMLIIEVLLKVWS